MSNYFYSVKLDAFKPETFEYEKVRKLLNEINRDKYGCWEIATLASGLYWNRKYDDYRNAIAAKIFTDRLDEFLENKDFSVIVSGRKDYILVNNYDRDEFFGCNDEAMNICIDEMLHLIQIE